MLGLEVTGASDDLIEIDGDIREEFDRFDSDGDYLAFSDGTVLRAVYDEDGIWRFAVVFQGNLFKEKIEGNVEDDQSDKVIFDYGIKWVLCGEDLAK